VSWSVETADRASALIFLPDGTGSGAIVTMRAGRFSTTRRVDWLSGAILHAEP
jgi:hypothetical protein